jgi:tryptophanyl-tRNA synthetase
LIKRVGAFLAPIQEKRQYYLTHRGEVEEIIQQGTGRARELAQHTMVEVRDVMRM